MLKKLHDIIARKADFFESAKMLFESVINEDIDNFIVLEAAKENEPESEVVEDPAIVQVPETELKPEESDVTEPKDNSIENEPMLKSDDTLTNKTPEDFENTPMNPDELDSDTVSSSKAEELADLMQVTFDLSSNTMADVIPITPKGAGEAIDSDTLAPMDSNLSSSEPEKPEEPEEPEVDNDDFENTPLNPDEPEVIEEPKEDDENDDNEEDDTVKESFSIYEAVTFGSDEPAEGESKEEEKPEENSEEAPDKKNAITNAVLDKVAESEEPPAEDPVADTPKEGDSAGNANPTDILKKLSTITDNIEATKKMILNNLNK